LVSLENKTDKTFALQEAVGSAENPTELKILWKKTGEVISVAPGKPYRHLEGYTINLTYPPDPNVRFPANLREGDSGLKLEGDEGKIDSIANNIVLIISSKSGKQYRRPFPQNK